MAHTQILFHSAAREKILRGASLLADAVRGSGSGSPTVNRIWFACAALLLLILLSATLWA